MRKALLAFLEFRIPKLVSYHVAMFSGVRCRKMPRLLLLMMRRVLRVTTASCGEFTVDLRCKWCFLRGFAMFSSYVISVGLLCYCRIC